VVKRKSYFRQSINELILVLAIIIVANLLFSNVFFRFDLTKEKRFSLSEASKNLATKIDEQLFIKVYLEGDFPSGFKNLSRSVKEMLDEFRVYSHNNIQYQFIDPFTGANSKQINDIIVELNSKGLRPTNVQIKKEDEFAQKIIVPGGIAFYKGREFPMNFLKEQFGQAPEEVINSSIELLEYEIANMLRKASVEHVSKIAIIEDHGELGRWDMAEAQSMLEEIYKVDRLPLSLQIPEKLNEYAGIIIAKPTQEFSEFDKFKIDQYIMNGGKVLWLLETQRAEMDSLMRDNLFVSDTYPLNLEDMLFRYGVRVNQNCVQDLQSGGIPVLSGMREGVPQQKILPWPFYPLAAGEINHPIVKGVEHVWFQFASSLDTIPNPDIKKTVLLRSSPASRVVTAPVRVDLNLARLDLDQDMFRKSHGNFILAVLLEGKFKSVFQHRFDAKADTSIKFIDQTEKGKMIVISDGDVIRNQVKKSSGEVYPLGYDRYTRQQYGNKKFILNCIDYLCDDSGIIDIRNKEITLRLLDKGKVKKGRSMWTAINFLGPLLGMLIFALINFWIRKRKYA